MLKQEMAKDDIKVSEKKMEEKYCYNNNTS
jgi:hypothetical protein